MAQTPANKANECHQTAAQSNTTPPIPPRRPYKERVDAAPYISRRYSRHTLAPVLPHSRVSRMLPEPGHLLSRRKSALSLPSSIPLYIRRTSTLLITTLFSSSAISSSLHSRHLLSTIAFSSGIMSSRNTQEDASRHGRMSPGQDIKYGIDESSESRCAINTICEHVLTVVLLASSAQHRTNRTAISGPTICNAIKLWLTRGSHSEEGSSRIRIERGRHHVAQHRRI